MKLIFSDPTPRWVPFVAVAMIVILSWVAAIWEGFDFATTTRFSVGLACVLFVLIFFQGRFFWKGQVDRLSGADGRYEALTSIWVGRGRRIPFAANEATNWTARTSGTRKEDGKPKLSTIAFDVKGHTLEMSFLNPALVDLDALSAINPGYFAKVKADFPWLKSISA
jgi:hypothetical protein